MASSSSSTSRCLVDFTVTETCFCPPVRCSSPPENSAVRRRDDDNNVEDVGRVGRVVVFVVRIGEAEAEAGVVVVVVVVVVVEFMGQRGEKNREEYKEK